MHLKTRLQVLKLNPKIISQLHSNEYKYLIAKDEQVDRIHLLYRGKGTGKASFKTRLPENPGEVGTKRSRCKGCKALE